MAWLLRARYVVPFCVQTVLLLSSIAVAQEPDPSGLVDELPQFLESDDLDWAAPWWDASVLEPGAFRLDLRAGHTFQAWEGQDSAASARGRKSHEYFALATLQVPLDDLFAKTRQWARRNRTTQAKSEVAGRHPDKGADEGQGEPEPQPARVEPAPPTTRPDAASPSAELHDSGVGSGEDTPGWDDAPADPRLILLVTRELAERVVRHSEAADARLRSLAKRSRWSGLSPELRLRGVLGFDRTTSTEESVGIYPGDTTVRGARDSLAEVRLTFRLDRLVLGNGEDSIERQRIQLAEEKRKRVAESVELFMDWRLANLLSQDLSLPPDDRLKARVQAELALAQLHLLTNGWFEGDETLRALRAELPDTTRER